MSKYITFRVKIISTGDVYETLAKDRVDAREMAADFYEVDYDDTECI